MVDLTRIQLSQLLYQETQPLHDIEKLTKLYNCKDELPNKDGEYLIYHTKYGYCTYGFTVKDQWGCDDLIVNKDGSKYNKVTHWGKLDFIKQEDSIA